MLESAAIGMHVVFTGKYAGGGGVIDKLTARSPKLWACVRVDMGWGKRWIWRGHMREKDPGE